MQPGPAAGRVLRAVGRALRAQWPWRVFCGCLGAVALARSACGRGWAPVAQAYSVSGQALLLGAWPGPLAGCILCTAGRPYCWACCRLRVFLFV